jgi:hypothetical protein
MAVSKRIVVVRVCLFLNRSIDSIHNYANLSSVYISLISIVRLFVTERTAIRTTIISIVTVIAIAVCVVSSIQTNSAMLAPLLEYYNIQEDVSIITAAKSSVSDKVNNFYADFEVRQSLEDDADDFFRYSQIRYNHNAIQSQRFLTQELHRVLQQSQRSEDHYVQRGQHDLNQSKPSQIILGRFGNSESHLMEYALLPVNTSKSIPSTFSSPGFYFYNATSFEEQRSTVQLLGRQRIASYSYMNLFAVFDWPHNNMQISQIKKWAPNSGYIHSFTMYPPCLPLRKTNITEPPPWTSTLENKVVLVIHPFIDTIRQQMTRIQAVWSNVTDDLVPGAPYTCFPNVKEMKYVRTPLPVDHPTLSWLESFENLKEEIQNIGYFDIALLGCGGYGLPLMTYISGLDFAPSAIYVGGSLQLFFGIHGARWAVNDASYLVWKPYYNDAWTWPLLSDIDNTTVGSIEGSAYVQPNT